jgi:hypothetical protein
MCVLISGFLCHSTPEREPIGSKLPKCVHISGVCCHSQSSGSAPGVPTCINVGRARCPGSSPPREGAHIGSLLPSNPGEWDGWPKGTRVSASTRAKKWAQPRLPVGRASTFKLWQQVDRMSARAWRLPPWARTTLISMSSLPAQIS